MLDRWAVIGKTEDNQWRVKRRLAARKKVKELPLCLQLYVICDQVSSKSPAIGALEYYVENLMNATGDGELAVVTAWNEETSTRTLILYVNREFDPTILFRDLQSRFPDLEIDTALHDDSDWLIFRRAQKRRS